MKLVKNKVLWNIQGILEHYKIQTKSELQEEINENTNQLRISYLKKRLEKIEFCLGGIK